LKAYAAPIVYTVQSGDTLSKVAEQIPLKGITLDQKLVVLYRANAGAFHSGNMNNLITGRQLTIPSGDAFGVITPQEAKRVVLDQYSSFTKAGPRDIRIAEQNKKYQIARVTEAVKLGGTPSYTVAPVILEATCLAMNIYYEARSDPIEGRLAVAWVTINRARRARTNICYEVFKPWQFSWTMDSGHWGSLPIGRAWEDALRAAAIVLEPGMADFTLGADHFHATNIYPKWAPNLKRLDQYGSHVFYRVR
jgi:FimV-like protein